MQSIYMYILDKEIYQKKKKKNIPKKIKKIKIF